MIEKIVHKYAVPSLSSFTHSHSHQIGVGDRPVRMLDFVTIRPQHVMTHDNTSAVMSKFLGLGATKIRDTRQPVFALDHNIQV
jgi:homoaconitate hydratase